MVLMDVNNRFVRVNAAFTQLLGYSEAELQLAMSDVTHPDDLAESDSRRAALPAGTRRPRVALRSTRGFTPQTRSKAPGGARYERNPGVFQMETRYRHKDGHVLWGLTNVSLVRDTSGQPMLYVGQVQDVTERKRSEEALARSVERLRILHQIDLALIKGERPEEIAGAAVAPLRELLGVSRAVVNLFDLASGEVEWLAKAEASPLPDLSGRPDGAHAGVRGQHRVHVGPGIRYSIRFMGDVEALRRGELQVIDVHALPPGPEVDALLASGVHSCVVVPMIAEGELIGALSFGGTEVALSPEQVTVAQEAASQFAISISQARLHERVKRQAQELEAQVTERKLAEEALCLAQQRLQHVVSSSPAVLCTLAVEDSDLRLTWISDNVRELLGYLPAEVFSPRWWQERVHPEDRQHACVRSVGPARQVGQRAGLRLGPRSSRGCCPTVAWPVSTASSTRTGPIAGSGASCGCRATRQAGPRKLWAPGRT